MLKLPVCPYCSAVYHYKEVKSSCKDKELVCRNCKKTFSVSYKKGRVLLIIAAALILMIFNVIMLNMFKNITVWGCLAFTIILLALACLLFPYTVRYKKIENKDKDRNKNKGKSKH